MITILTNISDQSNRIAEGTRWIYDQNNALSKQLKEEKINVVIDNETIIYQNEFILNKLE